MPDTPPQARPVALAPRTSSRPPVSPAPSPQSVALVRYYDDVQTRLRAQNLMRRDPGGTGDTAFDARDLARNFERIAFYNEHNRGGGLARAGNDPDMLRRWESPVRIKMEFGSTVSRDRRETDRDFVRRYADRLARVTGHPISYVDANANFHVLVMGEDDRETLKARVKQIVPNISPNVLVTVSELPRSVHCLVLGFSRQENDAVYREAIALVRAEHPTLMRQSCYHEEIAQGLGLANDSPAARPSIFNDDDEFALLTRQDEMLLQMLYDPRLKPGMTLEAARPIIRAMAQELTGSEI